MSHPPRHEPPRVTARTSMSRFRSTAMAVLLASLVAGCGSPAQLTFDDVSAQNHGGFGAAASSEEPVFGDVADDPAAESVAGEVTIVDGSPELPNDDAASGDGDPSTQAGVEKAFERLVTGWTACFHRPSRCDVSRLTAAKSPERQRLTESLAFYAAENMRTKPDEGRLQWAIESLTITSDDRARIMACEYDTRVFFDSSMAETEIGDIIFDTTIWTRRVEWTLARVDDSWSLWQRRIERRSPVARFCTP